MRSLLIFTILTLFVVLMDLYAIRGLQNLMPSSISGSRPFIMVYWGFTVLMLILLIRAGSLFQQMRDPARFFGVMLVMGIFLMFYLPKLLFNSTQLMSDLVLGIGRLLNKDAGSYRNWFLFPGAILGLLLFFSFGWGMIRGKTHVKIFTKSIEMPELPKSFDGLKIVQLSDIHLAGFYHNPDHIRKVVDMVNKLEPDLILFTGDLVHNFSEEVDPFVQILNELKAPLGKFAILGNHDYGHYHQWESVAEEEANLDRVKSQFRASGFDLLLNEHRTISLNGDSLQVLGVENWGKPPFPQLGNLSEAMTGTDPKLVRILLSHDPSHWDLQVREKEDIALTLSGHTHGMQFGIEIGGFKWSPSRWTYRHWAGLYKENGQYLYVNRGLGYTGFPGRIGIMPEITLLTLSKP
jgi:predicted MPP superfamily phosphohydrolase